MMVFLIRSLKANLRQCGVGGAIRVERQACRSLECAPTPCGTDAVGPVRS
jgi:hypothetical protein